MDDGIRDRKTVGFTAETLPLSRLQGADTDPFLHPFLKAITPWLRHDCNLPDRRELSFRDFGGWHDRMIISDLPADGNIRFRLVGTTAENIFGGLIKTGGTFQALPNTLFPDYASYFARIAAGGQFGQCVGLVPFAGREFLPIRVLDLAVSDDSGKPAFLYSFFRSNK